MMDLGKIPSKIEELSKKVLNCAAEHEEDGWLLVKHLQKEQLKVYSKQSAEFNGRMFKGECIIDASPETCFRHCSPKPESSRSSWDSSIKAMEMVQMIYKDQWPEAYILRTMTQSAVMGMISARDFVDLIININNEQVVGTMAESVTESVTAELCPPSPDFVRGINHYCGILNFRIEGEPNKTKLVYMVQTEIGGKLPVSLVEMAVPTAVTNFYSSLKKQIAKESVGK